MNKELILGLYKIDEDGVIEVQISLPTKKEYKKCKENRLERISEI